MRMTSEEARPLAKIIMEIMLNPDGWNLLSEIWYYVLLFGT